MAFNNGEVGLYLSSGTILTGFGQYSIVKDSSANFFEKAKSLIQNAVIDNTVTTEPGTIKFYLLTNKNKYSIKDKTENVISKNSLLSNAFNQANELIAILRSLEEKIKQGYSIIDVD